MKTELQVKAMLNGTELELINMNPVKNKKKRAEQDVLRMNLKSQRGVLMWVLADNPPSTSGAVTLETPKESKPATKEEEEKVEAAVKTAEENEAAIESAATSAVTLETPEEEPTDGAEKK